MVGDVIWNVDKVGSWVAYMIALKTTTGDFRESFDSSYRKCCNREASIYLLYTPEQLIRVTTGKRCNIKWK